MAIFHCLWVGALAGLVASLLIRSRSGATLVTSSIAVGILGALLGELAEPWLGALAPRGRASELAAAVVGAALTLIAWSLAQRLVTAARKGEKPADGGSGVTPAWPAKRRVREL